MTKDDDIIVSISFSSLHLKRFKQEYIASLIYLYLCYWRNGMADMAQYNNYLL